MDPIVTDLLRVLELGVQMRELQKSYFRSRHLQDLRDAQKAERAFDKQAKAALDNVAAAVTQGRLLP